MTLPYFFMLGSKVIGIKIIDYKMEVSGTYEKY